jgi:hypothetical protein
MKPLLQNLYQTRIRHFQEAVRTFIEGYREGLVAGREDAARAAEDGTAAHVHQQAPRPWKAGIDGVQSDVQSMDSAVVSPRVLPPHAGHAEGDGQGSCAARGGVVTASLSSDHTDNLSRDSKGVRTQQRNDF